MKHEDSEKSGAVARRDVLFLIRAAVHVEINAVIRPDMGLNILAAFKSLEQDVVDTKKGYIKQLGRLESEIVGLVHRNRAMENALEVISKRSIKVTNPTQDSAELMLGFIHNDCRLALLEARKES